jgi:hypothetical protein
MRTVMTKGPGRNKVCNNEGAAARRQEREYLRVFDRQGRRKCQTIVRNNRGRLTSNTAGVDAAVPKCVVYLDRALKV